MSLQGKRTSFVNQLLAVRREARIRNNPALWDAVETLTEVVHIDEILKAPEPDDDKVSECMERLFLPEASETEKELTPQENGS